MPPLAVFFTLDSVVVARNHPGDDATPTPGARAILDALDAQGVPTAVLTNSPSADVRPLLEALELVPNALVAADDVGAPTPAPAMIFRACEVLDVAPWEVLVVGTLDDDKRAAATAGALFAGIDGVAGNFTITSLYEVLSIVDGTHT
jgi:phosphoglycolate phosphatase-like HAD superfamily hydrolase